MHNGIDVFIFNSTAKIHILSIIRFTENTFKNEDQFSFLNTPSFFGYSYIWFLIFSSDI